MTTDFAVTTDELESTRSPDDVTDSTLGNSTDAPHRHSLGWVAAPVLLLLMVTVIVLLCGVWCRWLYGAGERRYWGRVHNEHLRATGSATESSGPRKERDSSEETDEGVDSDKKGLFSWNV